MADRLTGTRILILETREEAQFSKLLAEQGAEVVQCPMFTIQDAPDAAPVEAWIRRAIDKPLDDLVLMTGEGLRRIISSRAHAASTRPSSRRWPNRESSRAARSPARRCAKSRSRPSRPRRSRPPRA